MIFTILNGDKNGLLLLLIISFGLSLTEANGLQEGLRPAAPSLSEANKPCKEMAAWFG